MFSGTVQTIARIYDMHWQQSPMCCLAQPNHNRWRKKKWTVPTPNFTKKDIKDWQYGATFSHSMSNSPILIGFLFVLLFFRVYNCFFFRWLCDFFFASPYVYLFLCFVWTVGFLTHYPAFGKLNFAFFMRVCVCAFLSCLHFFASYIARPTQRAETYKEPHENWPIPMMISKTLSCARRKMRSH